jgi:hypothetical protein
MTTSFVPLSYSFVDKQAPLIDSAWLNPVNGAINALVNADSADGHGLDVMPFSLLVANS